VKEEKLKKHRDGESVKRYFVLETELCKGNLAEYLGFLRQNRIIMEEK